MVLTTYHAVYWSYRASRTDRWFLPCSIPWVLGLPGVAHNMTEDPKDRGYRPTRLWGQLLQLPRVGADHCLGERGTILYMWGPMGLYHGRGCRLLVAMEYYHVHIYDGVSRFGGPKEVPGWAESTNGLYDADKGAMKAEGQARLELPRNPGYTSMDFCMCGTGCRVHVGREDEMSKDIAHANALQLPLSYNITRGSIGGMLSIPQHERHNP